MKNWWHVRCVHFMSKLLIYKQLRLSYSKLSMLIFATFQFFMFWFKTNFVKWKFRFRNSLFRLKWKNESQKISFISQIWLKHWKRKNEKMIFFDSHQKSKIFEFVIWFQIKKWISKSSFLFQFCLWNWKMKNEKFSKFVLFLNQKTIYTLGRRIVVKYLNFVFYIEVKTNSNYKILNFVFQFIKNMKWHFGYTNSLHLN